MRNTLCNCHYSPSQTSFGCVEITLSVCPTLYAIVFGPYPSYRKLWKSLLHTNIAYDTRMCHGFFFFYQRSFEQIQGHWREKWTIYLRKFVPRLLQSLLLKTCWTEPCTPETVPSSKVDCTASFTFLSNNFCIQDIRRRLKTVHPLFSLRVSD